MHAGGGAQASPPGPDRQFEQAEGAVPVFVAKLVRHGIGQGVPPAGVRRERVAEGHSDDILAVERDRRPEPLPPHLRPESLEGPLHIRRPLTVGRLYEGFGEDRLQLCLQLGSLLAIEEPNRRSHASLCLSVETPSSSG